MFTTDEVLALESLLSFTDTALCHAAWSSSKSSAGCLADLFVWLADTNRTHGIDSFGLSLRQQEAVVAQMPESLRREIWDTTIMIFRRRLPNAQGQTFPDTLQVPVLNYDSRLFDYFRTLEHPKVDQVLDWYPDRYSQNIFWFMAQQHSGMDLRDERIRLMFAVQIITLNHEYINMYTSTQELLKTIAAEFEKRRSGESIDE